jgi:hypothetical protein
MVMIDNTALYLTNPNSQVATKKFHPQKSEASRVSKGKDPSQVGDFIKACLHPLINKSSPIYLAEDVFLGLIRLIVKENSLKLD